MSAKPHFNKPPVVEAIFDLFADRPLVGGAQPPSDDALAATFFATFPEFNGPSQPWRQATLGFQQGPGGAPIAFQSVDAAGVRRWRQDEKEAVLMGPTVLALNVRPPYGHFENQYAAQLKKLATTFCEVTGARQLRGLNHRYLNQVVFDLVDPKESSPAELFTLYPHLAEHLTKRHLPVQVQMEVRRFERGIVNAVLTLAANTTRQAVYVLDLAASATVLPPCTPEAIVEWHEKAHEHVLGAFLDVITPAARVRFQEQ